VSASLSRGSTFLDSPLRDLHSSKSLGEFFAGEAGVGILLQETKEIFALDEVHLPGIDGFASER